MLPALNWARDVPIVAFVGMVLTVTIPQLLTEPDIQSPRPTVSSKLHHEVLVDLERFDTRLWEDPRESIERGKRAARERDGDAEKSPSSQGSSFVKLEQLRNWIASSEESVQADTTYLPGPKGENAHAEPAAQGKVQVLAISMDFGAHPEQIESRRRIRFSLYTAMASSNFVPMDNRHIGGFLFSVSPRGPLYSMTSPAAPHVEVPFERFEPKDPHSGNPRIVVLWLDEDYFLGSATQGAVAPAASAEVLSTLRELQKELGITSITLIGPTTSDVLKSMLKSMSSAFHTNSDPTAPPAQTGDWLTIHSPSATAPPTSFLPFVWAADLKAGISDCKKSNDQDPDMARARATRCIRSIFQAYGIDFRIEVPDDGQVFRAINAELRYRWCTRRRPANPRFLLIGEVDTFYARELLGEGLVHQNNGARDRFCPPADHVANETLDKRVLPGSWQFVRFSFLRDLNDPYIEDDIAAREKIATRSLANSERVPSRLSIATAISEGDPQFDYVRRMVQRMADDEDRKQGGVDGVFAIGIFGGDDYDKLTWLRALRPKFPKALFVTTDLDARLWDPQNVDAARNMIVGSSFGLNPNEPLPDSPLGGMSPSTFPTFRKETQTAYFHAIRKATGAYDNPMARSPEFGADVVRVYELGLYHPHRLEQPQEFRLTASRSSHLAAKPPICRENGLIRTVVFLATDAGLSRAAFQFVVVLLLSYLLRYLCLPAVRFCLAGIRPISPGRLTQFRIVLATSVAALLLTSWWWPSLVLVALLLPWFCPFWGRDASTDTAVPPPILRPLRVALGAAAVGFLVYLGWLACQALDEACAGTGEPLALLDGVSIWGATIVRLMAISAGIISLLTMLDTMAINTLLCGKELGGAYPSRKSRTTRLIEFFRCAWQQKSAATGEDSFHAYAAASHWLPTLVVGALAALLLTLAAYGMFAVLGGSNAPARGPASVTLYRWSTISGAVSLFALLATLTYAVLTCRTWILQVGSEKNRPLWGSAAKDAMRKKYPLIGPVPDGIRDAEDKILGARFHTHLIALRTRALTPLVYAPFLIITLLLIARWDQFDYTNEAKSVIAMFTATILGSVAIVAALRNAASRVKESFLDDMSAALHEVRQKLGTNGVTKQRVARLESLRAETAAETSGAFQPILEQPVVKGLLIVMGGIGIPQLAEVFQWLT